jgi:hypothetical protein
MGSCCRKTPYKGFSKAVFNGDELGTYEDKSYIYTPDGMYRVKKTGVWSIDEARRRLGVLEETRCKKR